MSSHSLLKVQISTALVQTIGVLSKLLAARLLHLAEKVHGAVGDCLALHQALPRILELRFAQHIFLERGQVILCNDLKGELRGMGLCPSIPMMATYIVLVLAVLSQVERARTQRRTG